jgi:xanthine/CO dehydrogenase XdhC/CoxF family maturation factor
MPARNDDGKPDRPDYDTSDQSDASFGAALGCGGAIRILVERLHEQAEYHIDALRSVQSSRKAQVLVLSVSRARPGCRCAFYGT